MSLYAWLLLVSFVGPFLLSFDRKVAYYKIWLPLFIGIFVNGIIFILWDGWFARKDIWGFESDYVFSVRINNLPIEEWLFFFVIPYCSVFIYACSKAYFKLSHYSHWAIKINWFFMGFVCLLMVFGWNKTYTLVNGIIALSILTINSLKPKSWLIYFWVSYLIHLVPFFIINGVLTGYVTPKAVVWYNASEIIGLRLFTIPIEDSIYALSCLLIPITVMEKLSQKLKQVA